MKMETGVQQVLHTWSTGLVKKSKFGNHVSQSGEMKDF